MNSTSAESKIAVRELTADDFPCVEQLFGARDACSGCWCMHLRVAKGGKQLPTAFSYTGPENLFVSLGFTEIQRNAPTRPVYELKLK